MGRIYTVAWVGDITAADTDADLLEVLPADDKPVKLVGYVVGQTSEVGDSAEEGIAIEVLRLPATVTSGSGQTVTRPATPVAAPLDSADAAAGFAFEVNNDTIATTSGTIVYLDACAWNLRGSPLERWWPDPQTRPKAKQAEALIIRWQTTVADTVTVSFTAYLEEE